MVASGSIASRYIDGRIGIDRCRNIDGHIGVDRRGFLQIILRTRTGVLIVCTDSVTIGFAVCRIIGPIDTIRPALFVHYALITHPSIRTHRENSSDYPTEWE